MFTSRIRGGSPAWFGVALLVVVATSPAAEERANGHALLARCLDERNPGTCLNELIIVADMHDVVAAWGLGQSQWCMPENAPPERLRSAILAYLQADGRDLDEPSSRLIAAAYAEAFPCR